MIQSAAPRDEMKTVPCFVQTRSKFFESTILGAGNKSSPAIESMVCTNINFFEWFTLYTQVSLNIVPVFPIY